MSWVTKCLIIIDERRKHEDSCIKFVLQLPTYAFWFPFSPQLAIAQWRAREIEKVGISEARNV